MTQPSGKNTGVPDGPLGKAPPGGSHKQEQQNLDNVSDKDLSKTAKDENVDIHDHITTDSEWKQRIDGAQPPMNLALIPEQILQELLEPSVKQLAQQQEHLMPAPSQPQVDYMSISHEELYDSVQNKADPGAVNGLSQMWVKRANHMTEVQKHLIRGISASESGWSGNDADKARNSVVHLAKSAGQMQSGAHLAGESLGQQSTALSTARTDIHQPPTPKYDPDFARRTLASLEPDSDAYTAWDDYFTAQQKNEHDEHKKAAKAAQTYDHTTSQLAQKQPAFAPPPAATKHDGNDDGGGDDDKGGYDQGGRRPNIPPQIGDLNGGNDGTSDTGGGNRNGNGHTWDGVPDLPGDNGQDDGPTDTDPQGGGHTPPQHVPRLPHDPGGPHIPGPGGPGHRGPGGPTPVPGGPIGGGQGGGGDGSGTGGRRGGRFGGRGSLAGEGSSGRTGSGSGRTGAGTGRGGAAAGESARAGGRAAAGGRGAAGAAEGGTTGSRGTAAERGGRGGRPMMGSRGRGGQGEDDYEHETPDFLEGPGDDFWSPQEKTAPPVIGDWWGQYDPTKPNSYNPDREDG